MKKKITLLFLSIFCIVTLSAAEYTFERNIAYRNIPTSDKYIDSMCRLDVAHPIGASNAAVIVWFHGGGLTGGSREIPPELLKDGLIVVGVEYRLSPKATTAEIVDDAAAAVAWTMNNIDRFGGDRKKIYLSGHSAGGYLINMVGLNKTLLAKYGKDADELAGLIPFSGQAITHFETRHQKGISPLQPIIDDTAPLYYVRKECPPLLIISGDRELELYGRYEENAYFYRMFKLLGHPDVRLYELDGFDHGNMREPGFPLLLRFIRAHNKNIDVR